MLVSVAGYVRYSRASLLEVLNQDYIRTARAKGLTERTVIMRHAFRNALIPLTTIMAFDFAGILGGAIITEQVFAWRGMGTLFNTEFGRIRHHEGKYSNHGCNNCHCSKEKCMLAVFFHVRFGL
jgi:peptide/nickel transport system permease protein